MSPRAALGCNGHAGPPMVLTREHAGCKAPPLSLVPSPTADVVLSPRLQRLATPGPGSEWFGGEYSVLEVTEKLNT